MAFSITSISSATVSVIDLDVHESNKKAAILA
jgi:hypothetical protein